MTHTSTEQPELLPCPFCGEAPKMSKHFRYAAWNLIHRCKAIGTVSFEFTESKESIASRWNRRTPASQARVPLSEEAEQAAMYRWFKDRAEFKAWLPKAYRQPQETYTVHNMEVAFIAGMQAARRAQVVPQGWKLVPVELLERATESLGSFVSDHGWGQADMDTFDDLSALAAAPQPPEVGLKRENPTSKPEAAPVRMPEPCGIFNYGKDDRKPTYHHGDTDKEWLNKVLDDGVTGGPHRSEYAYTEHQVRQLLAAHGVK